MPSGTRRRPRVRRDRPASPGHRKAWAAGWLRGYSCSLPGSGWLGAQALPRGVHQFEGVVDVVVGELAVALQAGLKPDEPIIFPAHNFVNQ